MKRKGFIVFILVFILLGCDDKSVQVLENSNVFNNAQIERLEMENERMKNQLSELNN